MAGLFYPALLPLVFGVLHLSCWTLAEDLPSIQANPKGPSQGKLEHMVLDSAGSRVFIGGSNVIHVLSTEDLKPVKKILTGPLKDSLYCPPDPAQDCQCPLPDKESSECQKYQRTDQTNVNKALVLDAEQNTLIACGNLYYGFCQKVSLDSLEMGDSVYEPVAGASADHRTVMFLAPGPNPESALYVGVSSVAQDLPTNSPRMPILASRDPQILQFIKPTSFADMSSSSQFSVVDGFGYNDFNYFILVSRLQGGTSNSKIVRVCQKDTTYRSYVEMEIKCTVHGVVYKKASDASMGQLGANLAGKLNRIAGENTLFVSFQDTDSSAICLYSMPEIEDIFFQTVEKCFKGDGQLGPARLTAESTLCQKTSFNVSKTYCGEHTENAFIDGQMAVTPIAVVGPLDGALVTTIAVKNYARQTILYTGTETGNMVEVVAEAYDQWDTVRRMTLTQGQGQQVKEITLSSDGEDLYILSDLTIHKVEAAPDCTIHTTCETCISSDPHCGWCLGSKRCSLYEDCQPSDSASVVGYSEECPAVKTVEPESIALYDLKQGDSFKLELNMAVEGPVQCIAKEGTKVWNVDATLSASGIEVNCASFAGFSNILQDEGHLVANLTISSDYDFLPKEITIYDCAQINSCTECAEASYPCETCPDQEPTHPCAWCPSSHRCLSRTSTTQCPAAPSGMPEESGDGDKMSDLNLIPVDTSGNSTSRLRRAVENTIEDSGSCPQVALPTTPKPQRAHDNKFMHVQLNILNLLLYQKPLSCQFHLPDGTVKTKDATIASPPGQTPSVVECKNVLLTYATDDPSIDVPVTVVWDGDKILDNPHSVTVEVYKCSKLGLTCGQCGTMDFNYQCYWCDDKCVYQSQCLENKIARNATCPGPQIKKFSPSSGPVWGGTPLTVEGVNLGKTQPSDIQAWIGGIPCELDQALYQPPSRFVCVTGPATRAKYSMVEVTVGGKYNTSSNQQFGYLQPTVDGMNPKRGPLSGETIVMLQGRHLDIGSEVKVTVSGVEATVAETNASHVEFLSPEQDSKIEGDIKVLLDGNEVSAPSSDLVFEYLDDPVITAVKPLNVFVTGGINMNFSGTNLNAVRRPELVIYTGTGSSPMADCINVTASHMTCPIPDLSHSDLVLEPSTPLDLEYGVIMDGVKDTQRLTDKPQFSPLLVYSAPIFHPFDDVIKFVKDMVLIVKGERLDAIPGLFITVGSSPCPLLSLNATQAICEPPVEPDQLNNQKRAIVQVRLGQYKSIPGQLSYAGESMSHISMGIIMGIAVGVGILVLGVIIFCLICWCKYRHGKKNKRDSVFVPDTNHAVGRDAVDIEMEPIRPKQTPRPQISPPVLVKVPDGATNYKDATATQAEMAPLTQGESASLGGDEIVPGAATEDELTDGGDESDDWDEEEPYEETHFELRGLLDKLDDQTLKNDVKEVYIPRERLELGDVLGKGHFGCVYSATLRETLQKKTKVAVKTIQGSNLDQAAIEAFLKEGVIMKNFLHPHVLNLLGVCIENKNPMMVLPYMAHGDLRSYVKDKKRNFTARQLLQLAQQVAEGMAYLSALNFVHRDLAARNCMIDDKDVVKVADFGLSRDTYERDYFHSKDKKGKLPIKWMALESLQNLIFTSKSDVWSFGILLWELMTRGVSPYPDVDAFDVRDYLASGRRLYQPKYCPDNVYKIMLACWQENPKNRPTFIDLVNTMELMLNPPPKRPSPEPEGEEPMYMNVTRPASGEYVLDGKPTKPRMQPPRRPVPT